MSRYFSTYPSANVTGRHDSLRWMPLFPIISTPLLKMGSAKYTELFQSTRHVLISNAYTRRWLPE